MLRFTGSQESDTAGDWSNTSTLDTLSRLLWSPHCLPASAATSHSLCPTRSQKILLTAISAHAFSAHISPGAPTSEWKPRILWPTRPCRIRPCFPLCPPPLTVLQPHQPPTHQDTAASGPLHLLFCLPGMLFPQNPPDRFSLVSLSLLCVTS